MTVFVITACGLFFPQFSCPAKDICTKKCQVVRYCSNKQTNKQTNFVMTNNNLHSLTPPSPLPIPRGILNQSMTTDQALSQYLNPPGKTETTRFSFSSCSFLRTAFKHYDKSDGDDKSSDCSQKWALLPRVWQLAWTWKEKTDWQSKWTMFINPQEKIRKKERKNR